MVVPVVTIATILRLASLPPVARLTSGLYKVTMSKALLGVCVPSIILLVIRGGAIAAVLSLIEIVLVDRLFSW